MFLEERRVFDAEVFLELKISRLFMKRIGILITKFYTKIIIHEIFTAISAI